MDKKEYQKSLPKKRVSAGALIRNENEEVLVVKTTYKDYWSMPGGTVDENESPKDACKREIKEELDLDIEPDKLLSVSYEWPKEDNIEVIMFYFDCGIVNAETVRKIILQEEEIAEYQFLDPEKAKNLLSTSTNRRIDKAIQVLRDQDVSVYLEY